MAEVKLEPTAGKKLSANACGFLRLIARSPDLGDGWRQVSKVVWTLVEKFEHPELLDINAEQLQVRLNSEGATVARYLA